MPGCAQCTAVYGQHAHIAHEVLARSCHDSFLMAVTATANDGSPVNQTVVRCMADRNVVLTTFPLLRQAVALTELFARTDFTTSNQDPVMPKIKQALSTSIQLPPAPVWELMQTTNDEGRESDAWVSWVSKVEGALASAQFVNCQDLSRALLISTMSGISLVLSKRGGGGVGVAASTIVVGWWAMTTIVPILKKRFPGCDRIPAMTIPQLITTMHTVLSNATVGRRH